MIDYKVNEPISVKQFIELLNKTTLGARRPLEDEKRVAAMLHHADLLITAWDGERLVGVARSVTDFAYCCYLSDLAVDEQYQKQGIGLQLIEHTKQALHPQAQNCAVIRSTSRGLLSAYWIHSTYECMDKELKIFGKMTALLRSKKIDILIA